MAMIISPYLTGGNTWILGLEPQNKVYSAEHEAIIKAIYVTKRTGERRVIITDSLSTLMAIEGDINSKNPKTLSLRKLLNEEREKLPFSGPGN
jgi:archaellum biogenesis ATPase FlaH